MQEMMPSEGEILFIAEDTPEEELVERARSGDREAFGELVRRHRAQALCWASSVSHDTNLAEDIVQDALIRAFLHMGILLNTARFTPWLKQIVRNQAYYRLRRGGEYGKEQPFSSFETSGDPWKQVDWSSIDSILFHLSRSVSERGHEEEPAAILMRRETVEAIQELLHHLSPRERTIFEAYFFQHLSFQDIASLLSTPKANVYNLLSRSRKKVQKERVRVYFADYFKRRMEEKHPCRKVLETPFVL